MRPQLLAVLANVDVYSLLEPRAQSRFLSAAELVHFEAGGNLLREGDAASSFYVIISGTVRVTRRKRSSTGTSIVKTYDTEEAIAACPFTTFPPLRPLAS